MDIAIELRKNNLYANGRVVDFPQDGEQMLIRDKMVFTGDQDDFYPTVREGDRLDQLAFRYYGSQVNDASKYWWVIADANNIHDPFDLSAYVGKQLLVPNIQKVLLRL